MENNNKKSSVFYSYCLNPQVKFETYEDGEKLYLLLRSHPFTQVGWILGSILLFVLLFVLNIFIQSFFNLGQIFVLNTFVTVFILSYIWFNIINWYFNVGIVTNKKVVDIDFDSVLYKEVTVAGLDNIQDITIKAGGYLESLFDYGTISIQTAATIEANIEFDDVPHPTDAVQIINKLLSRKHGS
ncbi:PH domain-containing protein [bacterium]|nr:MAG: PH domain-containing protein [bacterium]